MKTDCAWTRDLAALRRSRSHACRVERCALRGAVVAIQSSTAAGHAGDIARRNELPGRNLSNRIIFCSMKA
jgi:hypothetical protein